MVDVEKVKKFLLDDVKKLDFAKVFEEKIGYDVFSVMSGYSSMISETIKNSGSPFEDKITGALFIGYLLRDFIATEELRESFENLFNEGDGPSFISYEEFITKYKNGGYTCDMVWKALKLDGNKAKSCNDYKCWSIPCYNCFREAYYGE